MWSSSSRGVEKLSPVASHKTHTRVSGISDLYNYYRWEEKLYLWTITIEGLVLFYFRIECVKNTIRWEKERERADFEALE